MISRLLIALAVLTVQTAPAPAFAAEEKPAKQVGQYVDLQPVALPIVANGVLLNYALVNLRVNLTASADVQKLREKEPYFRDALVREAHRTPFTLATDYEKIDDKRLIAAMMRITVAAAGPGVIQSVTLTSQSSQRRVRPPSPPPAAN